MNRILPYLVILCIAFFSIPLGAVNRAEIDFTPIPVSARGNHLKLEIQITNFTSHFIREARVYYRPFGEEQFRFQRLSTEGLNYYASIPTAGLQENLMEYYFDFEYEDGVHQVYPSGAPIAAVLKTSLRQQTTTGEDFIIIISPEPEEEIFNDEIVITVSFPRFSGEVDPERSRIYIDTWDITRYVQFFDDFLSFSPRQVPTGRHTIRVELFDKTGNLLASRNWSFFARKRQGPRPTGDGVSVNGQFYAEARNENLQDGNYSQNFNRTGLTLNGRQQNFSFGGRLFVSNQENNTRQPVNRYSAYAQIDFWNNRHLRLEGGDVYPEFNPFLLQNIFLRGGQASLYLKFFNVDAALGKSVRSIEGVVINDSTFIPGVFERNILAIRPSFGARQKFQFGLTFQKGKDDPASIQYGFEPKENLALGADLFLGLDRQRIILQGSVNASSVNTNIAGGSVPFDTLKNIVEDLEEDQRELYDLANKFITVNENLILKPGLAYQGQLRLRYFNNSFSFVYQYVEADFFSLGQPYLLRDNKGFSVSDNLSLLNNQLFLNIGFRQYENNLLDVKPAEATTENRTLFFNVSYFPLQNLPSITFGYNNYTRANDLAPDQFQLGIPEDNETHTTTFSSSYSFWTGNMEQRATVNLMNFRRNDNKIDFADNNANNLTVILQTKYSIPLQTNVEFMLQQSETASDSPNESNLELTSFGLGGQYQFTSVAAREDLLMLAINGRHGSVSSVVNPITFDYTRTFLNGRIIYSLPRYGRISINGDLVNYSGDRSYQDMIFTARYDVTF